MPLCPALLGVWPVSETARLWAHSGCPSSEQASCAIFPSEREGRKQQASLTTHVPWCREWMVPLSLEFLFCFHAYIFPHFPIFSLNSTTQFW